MDAKPLDPNLEVINIELKRLTDKAMTNPLSEDDLKRFESLLKMQQLLIDKPTIIIQKSYDDIYDKTVYAAINKTKARPKKKKIVKTMTQEEKKAQKREYAKEYYKKKRLEQRAKNTENARIKPKQDKSKVD